MKKLITILPLPVLVISLSLHILLPNQQLLKNNNSYSIVLTAFLVFYGIWAIGSLLSNLLSVKLHEHAPLAAVSFIILTVWELLTLKYNLLPLPFFPSPPKILQAIIGDGSTLAISTLYSLRLLFIGYLLGAVCGLITGTMMGWYQRFQYWVNPLVRVIGPIPSTAWIPIALAVFPGSFSASIFLIGLATWFPVTVMTWSGISNVNNTFFEIARTLGADDHYLITKIALPAASPMIFIGLFMGLGVSFVTLIVAEMLGVKAGLGWYIQWAQGWGEYYKVYASLAIMAVLFSVIISLLFKIRDKVLSWQKGLIKW